MKKSVIRGYKHPNVSKEDLLSHSAILKKFTHDELKQLPNATRDYDFIIQRKGKIKLVNSDNEKEIYLYGNNLFKEHRLTQAVIVKQKEYKNFSFQIMRGKEKKIERKFEEMDRKRV